MPTRTLPWLTVALAGLLPGAAAAQTADPSVPANWLIYGIIIVSGFAALFGALTTISILRRSAWSIAEAMSEGTEVTLFDAAGNPVLDAAGKPQTVTKMAASSSRLIAFLGLIAILTLFVAQGMILLWKSAHGGDITGDAEQFATYLVYGSVMFAPYVVNKFSSVFSSFGPGK
jgi:uncharacterized membrane protein